MQPTRCETIGLLLSKYVDGEAAPAERAQVDLHVAKCEDCAAKLLSFREMAAIFSSVGERTPEPHLRVTLFSQIERIKAYEEQMERLAQAPPPAAPVPPQATARPLHALAARLWSAAGSYVVLGSALFAVL